MSDWLQLGKCCHAGGLLLRTGWLMREVARIFITRSEIIRIGGFCRYPEIFIGPGTKVNELAAFTAEWPVGIVGVPFNIFFTGRAGS